MICYKKIYLFKIYRMKILAGYLAAMLCLLIIALTSSSYYDDAKTLKVFNHTAKQLQSLKVV